MGDALDLVAVVDGTTFTAGRGRYAVHKPEERLCTCIGHRVRAEVKRIINWII